MRQEPINTEQTENNDLTSVSSRERNKLLPKNDFIKNTNEYSATNKDALADGDDNGKGTGVFLDVFNESGGAKFDIIERKNNIKINEYNSKNKYPNFR
jgi:hypothetical protein